MFNQWIDLAARLMSSGSEKAARLDGMVARADNGTTRSSANLSRLADTFGSVETGAVADVQASESALAKAVNLLVGGPSGVDSGHASRALNTVTANVDRIDTLGGTTRQGAASLAAGDPGNSVGATGSRLGSSAGSARSVLDEVKQRLTAALNPSAGKSSVPILSSLQNSGVKSSSNRDRSAAFKSGLPDASAANSHLLILTAGMGASYYFNLSTAAFDALRRSSSYNVAAQDRLSRRPALQAVSKGGESISVSGAIFTKQSGAGQLDKLREIGFAMAPVMLTTGYGEALGQWYLTRIEEEQSGLFADGMPRKQQFTLEFARYGEDYSDL
jgi:uncharacterized protein